MTKTCLWQKGSRETALHPLFLLLLNCYDPSNLSNSAYRDLIHHKKVCFFYYLLDADTKPKRLTVNSHYSKFFLEALGDFQTKSL